MVTIRWYWIDGSYDEFDVNRHDAEAMRERAYKNPDIVSVEIYE